MKHAAPARSVLRAADDPFHHRVPPQRQIGTIVGGMRIYEIAQRGVNFLRDNKTCKAPAHRSLKDVKHTKHGLWANLIAITAEARGLRPKQPG